MKNPHFGYDKRSTGGDFLIDHFAGDVVYSCTKFLDKNRDTLSPGTLADHLSHCCCIAWPVVQTNTAQYANTSCCPDSLAPFRLYIFLWQLVPLHTTQL